MQIQEQVSLQPYNTFGLAVRARYYVRITKVHAIRHLLQHPAFLPMPKLVIGKGSNLLFTQDVAGWVLHMAIRGITVVKEDATAVWLQVGAGEVWHDFVKYCVQQGYGGVENLSLIPGTVGAAPVQNIGAYGVELCDVFVSLTAIDLTTGLVRTFTRSDCSFGYRTSCFNQALQGRYMILTVTCKLQKEPVFCTTYGLLQATLAATQVPISLQTIQAAIIQLRKSRLPNPKQWGNAGSFFKNPIVDALHFEQLKAQYPTLPGHAVAGGIKLPAAWLIEQCGWRGKRQGAVGLYPQHTLIVINYGGATGQEICQFAKKIQQSVAERFHITLLPEITIY